MEILAKSYKVFSSFILNVINTSVSLLKVLFIARKAPQMPIPMHETCIVLGNGPSLKTTLLNHPSHFLNVPLMCVNTFALTPEYLKLKPTYYAMLDSGMWLADEDIILQTMYNIRECTNWPLYLFVPMAAKKSRLITSLVENKNVRILYINYVVFKGFKTLAYLFFKKNKAIIQSQNVLVTSLFLTVNMGYKKIELVGAEHSWHEELRVNDDNLVCMKHVHFYEKDSEIKLIPFYKSRHKHETFYMHEIFIVWAKVFYGHVQVNSYANSRGSKIYNASETSYIDAYERIKL